MINSDNLYVINMTGIAYERDYISGEIVEYPFEDMDPYQIIQPYKTGNKIILEITSNKNARLSDNEILEAIITYEQYNYLTFWRNNGKIKENTEVTSKTQVQYLYFFRNVGLFNYYMY